MKSGRPKSKQILITGSAGFVGKALMRRLSQLGRPSISLYHNHLPEPLSHVTPVFGDLLKPDQLEPLVKQADEVVHLAWANSFKSMKSQATPDENAPNLEMLRGLISQMEEHGCRRLIFVSALGASRFADSFFLKEKYAAESLVLNSAIPERIILRTSLAYSDISGKDRLVQSIERLMRLPWFYPVPKFQKALSPIHVEDLTETILKLLDLPLPQSAQILEMTGPEKMALDELLKSVSQGIGKSHHIPLKGAIGDALTPLFEKLHGRKRFDGPSLRDLLTVAGSCDQAMETNNPLQKALPNQTHRFNQAMNAAKSDQPLIS